MTICENWNSHLTSLVMNQQILWKLLLRSGKQIFSDFDLYEGYDPWKNAKDYCNEQNDDIIGVSAIVPGQPEIPVYYESVGLDKIFIIRGIAQNVTNGPEEIIRFMSFGRVCGDVIIVNKFFWPECEFIENVEIREITPENTRLLYVKRENRSEQVQIPIDQ